MNKEDYSTYLNHPLWQQKRNEVFSKLGRKCSESECDSQENLEIHHKTYSPDKMPWEYPVENFEVLCEKHHTNHHGFEYKLHKCRNCPREIGPKFDYCLPCHNKLIEDKETEKKKLEDKITDLENSLKKESNRKDKENLNKKHQLKEEIELLTKEKINLEKNLAELRTIDDKFKEEIKADINNIESKIDILQREKHNKDNSSLEKQKRLEEEIAQLKKEMDKLIEDLEESKRIDKIKETFKINNQKIESKINLLIIGLILFAAIVLVIMFQSMNKEVPTNNTQAQLSKETTTTDRKENYPVNDIINNSPKNEENKILSRIDISKPSVNNGEANESNKKDKNDKVLFPKSTPQSSYKVISIDEVNSNLGNKVQISETISQVIEAKNGKVYLNIGGKYPINKLSAVVFKNNVGTLGELKKYENKLVNIKGTLSNYKGRAEIIINDNWQLREIEVNDRYANLMLGYTANYGYGSTDMSYALAFRQLESEFYKLKRAGVKSKYADVIFEYLSACKDEDAVFGSPGSIEDPNCQKASDIFNYTLDEIMRIRKNARNI